MAKAKPGKKVVSVIRKDSRCVTELKTYVIEEKATAEKKRFKNIVIEGDIERIGDGAFSSCEKLETVEIRDGVRTIGEKAFAHCPNLTSVVIPDSVEEIKAWAFSHCPKLTSVVIPDELKVIYPGAFVGSGLDLIRKGELLSAKKRSMQRAKESPTINRTRLAARALTICNTPTSR